MTDMRYALPCPCCNRVIRVVQDKLAPVVFHYECHACGKSGAIHLNAGDVVYWACK